MSTTTTSPTDSYMLKFEEIKGKVLAYIDDATSKKNDTNDTTKSAESTTAENESTEQQKDQLTILLNKVTSYVNKQESKVENTVQSEKAETTTRTEKPEEEDLQTKLTSFVRSLSIPNKGNSTEVTKEASNTTESRDDNVSNEVENKDPVKEIMDKLKLTFEGFGKKEEPKQRSLDVIDEADEVATESNEKKSDTADSNPIEDFLAFLQGMMKKETVNGDSKNQEAATETGALCGVF